MSIAATFQRAFRTKKLDPYPMEILNRVNHPTTVVESQKIPRLDERESGFNRALRGDWGASLSKERHRFVSKHPLSGALVNMQFTLSDIVDGKVSSQKAPNTDDPVTMAQRYEKMYQTAGGQ